MDALWVAVATIATLTLGLVAGYFYQIQLSRSFEQKLARRVQQELEEVEAQQLTEEWLEAHPAPMNSNCSVISR